jgi:hypothetical protein
MRHYRMNADSTVAGPAQPPRWWIPQAWRHDFDDEDDTLAATTAVCGVGGGRVSSRMTGLLTRSFD